MNAWFEFDSSPSHNSMSNVGIETRTHSSWNKCTFTHRIQSIVGPRKFGHNFQLLIFNHHEIQLVMKLLESDSDVFAPSVASMLRSRWSVTNYQPVNLRYIDVVIIFFLFLSFIFIHSVCNFIRSSICNRICLCSSLSCSCSSIWFCFNFLCLTLASPCFWSKFWRSCWSKWTRLTACNLNQETGKVISIVVWLQAIFGACGNELQLPFQSGLSWFVQNQKLNWSEWCFLSIGPSCQGHTTTCLT